MEKSEMKTLLFDSDEKSSALAKKYGYDEWMIGRFLKYTPDTQAFLEKMEQKPKQYIRTNTIKTDRHSLQKKLQSKGVELKDTWLSDVFEVVKSPFSIGATSEYLLGLYYIQDLSSCVAVEAMDIESGQHVLDMAAAPGGKTSFIAQKLQNSGLVVALEPNERRIKSMEFNLTRCGVTNTSIYKIRGEEAEELGLKFDRVLLDAPCSCEGVIAKDVKRKTNHTPEDVDFCSTRQQQLIMTAAGLVRPGGILVYSTCSFAPEENEMVVNWLVDQMARKSRKVSIEPVRYGTEGLVSFGGIQFNQDMKNTRRLYPHLHDTTGFFVAKLRIGA